MLMVIQPQTTRTPKFNKSCFHLRRIAQLHFILHGVTGLVQIGLHVTDIVRRSWIPFMHSWNIKGELDMKGSIHRIFQGTLQIKSLSRTVELSLGLLVLALRVPKSPETPAQLQWFHPLVPGKHSSRGAGEQREETSRPVCIKIFQRTVATK